MPFYNYKIITKFIVCLFFTKLLHPIIGTTLFFFSFCYILIWFLLEFNYNYLSLIDYHVLIQFKEEVLDPKLVPPCFESNIQLVHFGRLGDEHEMCFVKYVLEKALVLETVKYITYGLCWCIFNMLRKIYFHLREVKNWQ